MKWSRTLLLFALILLVPLRWYIKRYDTEVDTGFFIQVDAVVWAFLFLLLFCLIFFAIDRLLHKRHEEVGVSHPIPLGLVGIGAGVAVLLSNGMELFLNPSNSAPLSLLHLLLGVLTGLMLLWIGIQLLSKHSARLSLWLTLPPALWQAFLVIEKYVNNSVSLYIFDYVAEIFMVCAFWVFWIAHSRLIGEYDEEHKAYSLATFSGCCASLLGFVLAIPQFLVASPLNMGQGELISTLALSCYTLAFVLCVRGGHRPSWHLKPDVQSPTPEMPA